MCVCVYSMNMSMSMSMSMSKSSSKSTTPTIHKQPTEVHVTRSIYSIVVVPVAVGGGTQKKTGTKKTKGDKKKDKAIYGCIIIIIKLSSTNVKIF